MTLAGSLSIELIANVAKLQTDMKNIEKAVYGAEGAIARSTRAMDANFDRMSGGLSRAANASTRAFNQIGGASNAQRAGMQQLSYQLSDVATMYSLGAKPAQIFASQIGQVTQAIQLAAGGTSQFAAFLGGPWGIAIMAGVTVLGALIGKLMESENAAGSAAAKYRDAASAVRELSGSMNASKLLEAQMKLNDARNRKLELENRLQSGPTSLNDRFNKGSLGQSIRDANLRRELTALNWLILEQGNIVGLAEKENQKLAASFGKVGAGAAGGSRSIRAHSAAVREAVSEYQKLGKALEAMQGDFQKLLVDDLQRVRGAARDSGDAAFDMILDGMARRGDAASEAMRAASTATDDLNRALFDTVNLLDRQGGLGKALGDMGALMLSLRTGDFSGLRGPLGVIAGSLSQAGWIGKDKNGEKMVYLLSEEFAKVLDGVFGGQGSFLKALQGAGVGAAVGSMVFGGSKAGQIGSTVGGMFGEALLKKFAGQKLFDKLGSFAGPIGMIGGALLGGLIGSLFKKTKNGAAVISNTGVSAFGNDANLTANAKAQGGAIQSTIQNIANQLGGTVGAYKVSIAQRSSGWIHVDGGGASNVGAKKWHQSPGAQVVYNGKDPEEALRLALMNAIQDGAIQGISAGAQRLIRAGRDIEGQIAKAIKFEGVFTELKQMADPLGFALDAVTKQFAELRTIFAEAGASAADYAKLEQLLALKREAAMDDARRATVDKVRDPIQMQIRILELLGKSEASLAGSRLLELAGLKASLQPMQSLIYQLEDARGVIDTFQPLADDLKRYREELVGGQGAASFGQIAAQFRAVAMAAGNGDAAAMGQLRGVSGAFLDAARDNAGSDLAYRRALGEVLAGVDRGIFAADTQADYAQAQIDAINANSDILAAMRAEMMTLQTQVVENTGFVARLWSRLEGDGILIKTDNDPIKVDVI